MKQSNGNPDELYAGANSGADDIPLRKQGAQPQRGQNRQTGHATKDVKDRPRRMHYEINSLKNY
jgi:hypothetical protein